jgi:hypothetical protein
MGKSGSAGSVVNLYRPGVREAQCREYIGTNSLPPKGAVGEAKTRRTAPFEELRDVSGTEMRALTSRVSGSSSSPEQPVMRNTLRAIRHMQSRLRACLKHQPLCPCPWGTHGWMPAFWLIHPVVTGRVCPRFPSCRLLLSYPPRRVSLRRCHDGLTFTLVRRVSVRGGSLRGAESPVEGRMRRCWTVGAASADKACI